jgi:hypothetical protein
MPKVLLAIVLGVVSVACAREAPPARPAAATVAAPQGAPATPAPPSPVGSPIAVLIAVETKEGSPSPLAQEWAKELQAVLAANPVQFRLVKTSTEADLTVRIERVVAPPDSPGHQLMTLWLAVGKESTRFTLDYTGGPAAMAGRLARFLVGHVEKARAAASPKPPSQP